MSRVPSIVCIALVTLSLLSPCGECGHVKQLGYYWDIFENAKAYRLEEAFDVLERGQSIAVSGDILVERTLRTNKRDVRLISTDGATIRFAPGVDKLVDFTGADIEIVGVTFADFEIPFDVSNARVEIRDCTFTSNSGRMLKKIDEDSHHVTSLLVSRSKFIHIVKQGTTIPKSGGIMRIELTKSELKISDTIFSGGKAETGGCLSVRIGGSDAFPTKFTLLRSAFKGCTATTKVRDHYEVDFQRATNLLVTAPRSGPDANTYTTDAITPDPTVAPLKNPTMCDQSSMRMGVGYRGVEQARCLASGHCWDDYSTDPVWQCYARWNQGKNVAAAFEEGSTCHVEGPKRVATNWNNHRKSGCLNIHACWNVSPGFPSCYWPTNIV